MRFTKESGTFKSADGRHDIAYYVYTPAGAPKAVLQISHGMCEYIERYEDFIGYLCGRGFLVCGNDHLGHGRLAQASGDLGYFAPEEGWKLLAEDVHTLTRLMKERFPALPYSLLGHSMGSFVARCYLVRYGEELDAAVIMGTSGGNPFASLGILLAGLEIRLHGERCRSPLLNQLSMGGNNRRFKEEHDKDSWLSKDLEIRASYAANPLCSFVFTASGFRDLFSLLRFVSAPGWAAQAPKDLPVLLVSGEDDPIGADGKGVKKVYDRLKAAGVTDVTLRLFPGDRHEILNETDRKQVYQEIGDYLDSRLG